MSAHDTASTITAPSDNTAHQAGHHILQKLGNFGRALDPLLDALVIAGFVVKTAEGYGLVKDKLIHHAPKVASGEHEKTYLDLLTELSSGQLHALLLVWDLGEHQRAALEHHLGKWAKQNKTAALLILETILEVPDSDEMTRRAIKARAIKPEKDYLEVEVKDYLRDELPKTTAEMKRSRYGRFVELVSR